MGSTFALEPRLRRVRGDRQVSGLDSQEIPDPWSNDSKTMAGKTIDDRAQQGVCLRSRTKGARTAYQNQRVFDGPSPAPMRDCELLRQRFLRPDIAINS